MLCTYECVLPVELPKLLRGFAALVLGATLMKSEVLQSLFMLLYYFTVAHHNPDDAAHNPRVVLQRIDLAPQGKILHSAVKSTQRVILE